MKKHKPIEELLTDRSEQVRKLQRIVTDSIDEQELILGNLLHPPQEMLTHGQRLSDKVAAFGGSWLFIGSFFVLLTIWILFNSLAPNQADFDPYPFILMNLILSCIAALQAPIIMMSQNRQEEKDRKRGENDYLINLKAELEVRSLHQKMDLLLQEEVRELFAVQDKQNALLKEINEKLGKLTAR